MNVLELEGAVCAGAVPGRRERAVVHAVYDGTAADFRGAAGDACLQLRQVGRRYVGVRAVLDIAARPHAFQRLRLRTGSLVVTESGRPMVCLESSRRASGSLPVCVDAVEVLKRGSDGGSGSDTVTLPPPEDTPTVLCSFLAVLAVMLYFVAFPCVIAPLHV